MGAYEAKGFTLPYNFAVNVNIISYILFDSLRVYQSPPCL